MEKLPVFISCKVDELVNEGMLIRHSTMNMDKFVNQLAKIKLTTIELCTLIT